MSDEFEVLAKAISQSRILCRQSRAARSEFREAKKEMLAEWSRLHDRIRGGARPSGPADLPFLPAIAGLSLPLRTE
jgi:hypothetical protein